MRHFVKPLLLFVLCLGCQYSMATHYRAGEILYELIGNLKYQVQVITYTKISYPSNLADRDSVEVDWGDGTTSLIPRINGTMDGSCQGASPCGVVVLTDVKKNVYQGVHQYTGTPPPGPGGTPGFFVIKFFDENRLGGIANIDNGNSIQVTFYVEDTLFYPGAYENIGGFSSPVLENPAVQYAFYCDTFRTNPEAVDPDGDSLDYYLVPCKANQNNDVPLYIFPDAYCNQNSLTCPSAGHNTCTIDPHTGNFVWTEPCAQGFYNVGILIHKYRHGVCLGSILRDFQIIVLPENDPPPHLIMPHDTCVRAGDQLKARICATDNSTATNPLIISLSAVGLPFQLATSPAVFDSISGRPELCQNFTWNTNCDDIQLQPYMMYFKAEDNFTSAGPDGTDPYHAQDIETWQVTVVPPPVLNLTAVANHQSVVLNWQNPYSCANSPNFRGFSVWRRVGCDPFVPSYCETGLAGTGYVKITTNNINAYTYTDNTVVPGQAYSYRVLAEFYKLPPSGIVTLQFDNQESVPSNEVCINAPIDIPVILNADVLTTDANNGQIYVRWAKPLAGGVNLDTIQDHPPYRFDLYRGSGYNFGAPQTLIHSSTYNSYYAMPDTSNNYTDAGINTVTGPWSYKIYFYATPDSAGATDYTDTVGSSASASSVYLNVQTSDQTLYLHWKYNVPWSNDSFAVYRQNHINNNWDSIGVSYTLSYADTGLINDTTYCYFVKSYGHYTSGLFPQPLLNKSERVCTAPVDTVPPCPPSLTVANECNYYNGQPWDTTQYVNNLKWTNHEDSCALGVVHYRIYFNATDSTNFALIDSTTSINDTTFTHVLADNISGCYAVTAVDKSGFESALSNIVCVDNCPYYVLPNAFTPDGDSHNDYFTPFPGYRFVPKIEMQIFNRWGEKVFETTDPAIRWDGRDLSGHPVSDGVYLYAGYYYEQHINGLIKKPLSGAKKGGGFIHVIRGK